jgi:hypothetical protein
LEQWHNTLTFLVFIIGLRLLDHSLRQRVKFGLSSDRQTFFSVLKNLLEIEG